MKCPKCGYVSHDYLEVCRKCGRDLVAFKRDMGLFVLQPGVLDLSLVLVEAGADDLFESVEMTESIEAAPDEGIDDVDVASAAATPGAMTSVPLQDLVLAEDTPIVPAEQDVTTSDAAGLGDVDATTLPEHLTLELDTAEIMPQWSSLTLDDVQFDDPPGDVQSNMSPPQNQASDEETSLLDLDDLASDDDAQA